MSDTILVARESFTVDIDGVPTAFRGGHTRVRQGHPVLKGREELFEPIEVHYDHETTTAAPGEKREGVKRSKGGARKGAKGEETTTAAPGENASDDAAASDAEKPKA